MSSSYTRHLQPYLNPGRSNTPCDINFRASSDMTDNSAPSRMWARISDSSFLRTLPLAWVVPSCGQGHTPRMRGNRWPSLHGTRACHALRTPSFVGGSSWLHVANVPENSTLSTWYMVTSNSSSTTYHSLTTPCSLATSARCISDPQSTAREAWVHSHLARGDEGGLACLDQRTDHASAKPSTLSPGTTTSPPERAMSITTDSAKMLGLTPRRSSSQASEGRGRCRFQ